MYRILRKGYYREYIDRLFHTFNQDPELKVDYLLITGDFIDKGKVENFQNVETIVKYICTKFQIDHDKVLLSIGNHDYKYKELLTCEHTTEKELKAHFKKFRDTFNGKFDIEQDYYTLHKIADDILFLSVDSTYTSTDGKPGLLNTSEIDHLINSIKDLANNNSTLLIGCHFPIISYSDNFLASEEDDWHNKHVWLKGHGLHDRIKKLHLKNTLWFHGDVHAGDSREIENEIFILTSKFGGECDRTEQRRQANLIVVDENSISRVTFTYEFPTHTQDPNLGDWKRSQNNEIRIFSKSQEEIVIPKQNLSPIDTEVETEILRKIEQKNLYNFGRFHVNDEYISLGWVDIGKLFRDKDLLNRISDKSYELIKSKKWCNSCETIFLGVEIIGGILASQLSVRFDVRNSIIPVRSKTEHYSDLEMSHASSFNNHNLKDVIIFIDIISSGSTINSLVNEILAINGDLRIHVIAIISNDIEDKLIKIPKTKSYHSFCTSLKIPIIKNEDMPAENFVKANLKH